MSSELVRRVDAGLQLAAQSAASGLAASIAAGASPVGALLVGLGQPLAAAAIARLTAMTLDAPQESRARAALDGLEDQAGRLVDAGGLLRRDGFGQTPQGGGDAPAVELLEGVLRAAARDHESRKADHLGRLWTNAAMDDGVDFRGASYALRVAESLTYRQLCLIALFADAGSEEWQPRLLALDAQREESPPVVDPSLVAEFDSLGSQALIGVLQEGGLVYTPQAVLEGAFSKLPLARLRPMETGALLHRLLALDAVPRGEIEAVFAELGGEAP